MGVDIIYFADFGMSADNLQAFALKNTIFGFGLGGRFFLSGVGVIGLDFGFNPYGNWNLHPSDNLN